MTFTAERTNTLKVSNLKKITALLKTIIISKSRPILECAYFSKEFGEDLNIKFTNLRQQWTVKLSADDDAQIDDVAYPLSDVSAIATDKEMSFDFQTNHLGAYKLYPCTEDMPQDLTNLQPATTNEITLTAKELKEAIKKVGFSVSTNELKQLLCNILVEVDNGWVTFASTDGHRLSTYRFNTHVGSPSFNFYISQDLIKAVDKLCSVATSNIIINVSEDEMTCLSFEASTKFGDVRLDVNAPGVGKFPNYRSLIPDKFNDVLEILGAKQLAEDLTVLSKIHKDCMVVRFIQGECKTYFDADLKSFIRSIPAAIEPIAFNAKYFIDFLKAANKDDLSLEVNTPLSPVAYSSDGWFHLLMPTQIRD